MLDIWIIAFILGMVLHESLCCPIRPILNTKMTI